jgi:PAS domain S-box-containing protein
MKLSSALEKNSLVSIFVIGTLIFIAFTSVLYRQYTETRHINETAFHDYEIMRRAHMAYTNLLNMGIGVRGYLLTGKKHFLDPYETAKISSDENLEAVKQLAVGDLEKERQLDDMTAQAQAFANLLRDEIDTFDAKGKTAITTETLDLQKQEMDNLRTRLDAFLQDNRINLKKLLDTSQERNTKFIYTLVVGMVSAIGAMLLITLLILSLLARNKKAQEKIKESEERLLTIMNGLNDGLFDYNVEQNSIYFSPSFKAMLGYKDDEFANSLAAFRHHLHPDDIDMTFDIARHYRDRKIPIYSNTFRLRHKNEGWRWILARGTGVWNQQGKMIRFIGTHTDITEQKNREEELKQLNTDLESFIYIASHDLRSPLVNLKGFAGEIDFTLRQSKPVLDRAKLTLSDKDDRFISHAFEKDIPESLNFISKAVEKMDTLTNAVLDLSRIGKRELNFGMVNTTALVKRCLDSLAYVIMQKDAEVVCGPLPEIFSDAVALEHIFTNLLDNAIKYLAPERKGRIAISSQPNGKGVIFSVKDNGRGIAKEDQKKVFEIFRRARNTGDVQGLGMGMAYVKTTARKLGGTIWLDSTLGEGTTFYFHLPLSQEAVKETALEMQ